MTIRRQYSLPNCTLILEGLTDAASGTNQFDFRPVLSILMSAECSITGHPQPLTGGRDFFESLIKAVSSYAKEFLSGVPLPKPENGSANAVQLQRVSENLHRLTFYPLETENGVSADHKPKLPVQMDLTTVQLFDLVEAVDQFFADTQTLPELSLQLSPISKRFAKHREPVAKRTLPATLGVSSLALAALAFFFVPIPEVQRPRDPIPQPNSSGNLVTPTSSGSGSPKPQPVTPTGSPSPAPSASSTVSPSPVTSPSSTVPPSPVPSASSTVSPSPVTSPSSTVPSSPVTSPSSTVSPSPTTSSSSVTSPSPVASPLSAEDLQVSEAVTPKITDATELEELSQKVYQTINGAWKSQPEFKKDLMYRVSVARDGSIVGYKPVNPEGNDDRQTPLPDLLYKPVGNRPTGEPLADFRVVFTPKGVLQVSPW